MELWDDGRSGEAGCAAGNIALGHLASQGMRFRKVRGTTFESSDAIWISRVCSSDSYLSGGVAHWANISWDQHRDMLSEAQANNRSLIYLFVTGTEKPAAVHYWRVPAQVVECVLVQQGKNSRGATYGLHLIHDNGTYRIGEFDVTQYHAAVPLASNAAERLVAGFESTRQKKAAKRISPLVIEPERMPTAEDRDIQRFEVPLTGGRVARLGVPVPISGSDLQRLKGWLDLMADILTGQND